MEKSSRQKRHGRIGSGLSLEFAFHTWTTQWEILLSDMFTTTQHSLECWGEGWSSRQRQELMYTFCCRDFSSWHIDTGLSSYHQELYWHPCCLLHSWLFFFIYPFSFPFCFLHLPHVRNVTSTQPRPQLIYFCYHIGSFWLSQTFYLGVGRRNSAEKLQALPRTFSLTHSATPENVCRLSHGHVFIDTFSYSRECPEVLWSSVHVFKQLHCP